MIFFSINSSLDPEVEIKEPEGNITKELISPRDRGQKRRKKFDDTENHLKELRKSITLLSRRDDDDCDKLFLLSLLAHLKTVPDNKKLFAKAEIIQVLTKYNDPPQFGATTPSDNWQNSSPSPTPVPQYLPRSQNQYYGSYTSQHIPPRPQPTHSPSPSEVSTSLSTNESLSNESS